VGEMTNHTRDILVLSAISILLMIGTYKCGREQTQSEIIQPVPTQIVEKRIEPENSIDEDYYEEEVQEEHFLIVGSFTDEQIAQEYVDRLLKESNDAFITEQDGYYRVSIYSSNNLQDVVRKKEQLAYTEQKMWVYSRYYN
jgi:cell division septation protein DedD